MSEERQYHSILVERPDWTMRRTPSAQVQPGQGSPSLP